MRNIIHICAYIHAYIYIYNIHYIIKAGMVYLERGYKQVEFEVGIRGINMTKG